MWKAVIFDLLSDGFNLRIAEKERMLNRVLQPKFEHQNMQTSNPFIINYNFSL